MLTPEQQAALGGSGGGMSREAALAKRNALTSDPAFAKRLMDGDAAALDELKTIANACVGTPENWSRFPQNKGLHHDGYGHEVDPSDGRAIPV
jgi:hypothetical protein